MPDDPKLQQELQRWRAQQAAAAQGVIPPVMPPQPPQPVAPPASPAIAALKAVQPLDMSEDAQVKRALAAGKLDAWEAANMGGATSRDIQLPADPLHGLKAAAPLPIR